MSTQTAVRRTGSGRPHRPPLVPTWAAKVVMAVTGIVFVLFVFVHMVGNLKVYQGPADFDAYAAWLRTIFYPLLPHGGMLWFLRMVLLVSLVLHVACAALLTVRARRARGSHRAKPRTTRLSLPARTMVVTGLVLLGFIVFHVLDLTTGTTPAATEAFEHGSAYANLVASMARPVAGGFYLVTMLLLAVHILHGAATAANDLGVTGRRTVATVTWVGWLVAAAVLLGNASIPVAVWAGWL